MIPKILHTVWIGNKTPKNDFRKEWNIFNEWTIINWTDDRIDEEFKDDPILQKLKRDFGPTMISDYVRLIALKKYGGVYSDVDMLYLKPFDELIKDIDAFLTYQFPHIPAKKLKKKTPRGLSLHECVKNKVNVYEMYHEDIYLNNNMIGSIPNGELINTFIDVFVSNLRKPVGERFSFVDYGAGPAMTTFVGNMFVNLNGYTQVHEDVTIFQSSVFHPTNYVQYSQYNYSRNFKDAIPKQIEYAKKLGSYAVHFQVSQEVGEYLET